MSDITKLHPDLQNALKIFQQKCDESGWTIGIGECVRTIAEQDALYAKGRTAPGTKVTNAKGSTYSSMHQWGIALDIYRNDGKGAYYDGDGFFSKVGKIGQSIGLEWGGAWTSIKDKPHFQLADWGSTPTKLKALYKTPEKFMETWKKAVPVSYIVSGIDYSLVFDATQYSNNYADLKAAYGSDSAKLLNHFVVDGMREGRQAISTFNVQTYRARYADLQLAFGNDLKKYYLHYITDGHREGRAAV